MNCPSLHMGNSVWHRPCSSNGTSWSCGKRGGRARGTCRCCCLCSCSHQIKPEPCKAFISFFPAGEHSSICAHRWKSHPLSRVTRGQFGMFLLVSFLCPPRPCSSIAATHICCCLWERTGERGSRCGVRTKPWGTEHGQRRKVRKRCLAWCASPRCPPRRWLSGLSCSSPACAGVHCWRLGHTINQNLPLPFD